MPDYLESGYNYDITLLFVCNVSHIINNNNNNNNIECESVSVTHSIYFEYFQIYSVKLQVAMRNIYQTCHYQC